MKIYKEFIFLVCDHYIHCEKPGSGAVPHVMPCSPGTVWNSIEVRDYKTELLEDFDRRIMMRFLISRIHNCCFVSCLSLCLIDTESNKQYKREKGRSVTSVFRDFATTRTILLLPVELWKLASLLMKIANRNQE